MAYTGGGNGGFMFITLKPLGHGCNERAPKCGERQTSAMDVINRLRPKMNRLPVASAFLQPAQDLRIGGRSSSALYQYTIQSDDIDDLAHWGPILYENMQKLPDLQDVNTDQQNGGLQEMLNYDRVTAARLGQTPQSLDSSLYSAFGQSEVSVIYTQLNQYYVVMEVAPPYWQDPSDFEQHLLHIPRDPHPPGLNAVSPLATVAEAEHQHHSAAGRSHRAFPVGHRFLQPEKRRLAERCHAGSVADGAKAGDAWHGAADSLPEPRRLTRNPCQASDIWCSLHCCRSSSCWAFSTRAWFTR